MNVFIYAISSVIGSIMLSIALYAYGPGMDPDAIAYLSMSSESLRFFYYPFLYPIILRLAGLFTVNYLYAAALVNLLLIIINTFTAVKLVGGNRLKTVLTGLLLGLSVDFISVHYAVLSEPVFLLLLSISIFTAISLAGSYSRSRMLIYAAIVSLMCLSRYAAIGIVPAAVLILSKYCRKKPLDIFIFMLISLFPVLIYMSIAGGQGNHLGGRRLSLHFPDHHIFIEILSTVSSWMPYDILHAGSNKSFAAYMFVALIILALIYIFIMSWTKLNVKQKIISTYIISYISFLILTQVFTSNLIPFDSRMLIPVYYLGIILIMNSIKIESILSIPGLIILSFIISYFVRSLDYSLDRLAGGSLGFNGTSWVYSPTVNFVKSLDKDIVIFSNFVNPYVYFHSGTVDDLGISHIKDPTSNSKDFEELLKKLNFIASQDKYIIAYNKDENYEYFDELARTLGFKKVKNFTKAAFYAKKTDNYKITYIKEGR